jgi:hypothetical protein
MGVRFTGTNQDGMEWNQDCSQDEVEWNGNSNDFYWSCVAIVGM